MACSAGHYLLHCPGENTVGHVAEGELLLVGVPEEGVAHHAGVENQPHHPGAVPLFDQFFMFTLEGNEVPYDAPLLQRGVQKIDGPDGVIGGLGTLNRLLSEFLSRQGAGGKAALAQVLLGGMGQRTYEEGDTMERSSLFSIRTPH